MEKIRGSRQALETEAFTKRVTLRKLGQAYLSTGKRLAATGLPEVISYRLDGVSIEKVITVRFGSRFELVKAANSGL
jgi:hypothetical protein